MRGAGGYVSVSLVARNHSDPDFVFHATRHTAAFKMANELGINTMVIAQALGHSSLQTTQKYVKAKPKYLLEIGVQI